MHTAFEKTWGVIWGVGMSVIKSTQHTIVTLVDKMFAVLFSFAAAQL